MTATTIGALRGLGSKSKSNEKSRASTERLHVAFTPRMMERLDYLKEKTEAASYTEVLRNAMRLYDALVQEVEDGNELCVRDKEGNITAYKFL